jgi:nitrogen-specific signal transduction histidine kinase
VIKGSAEMLTQKLGESNPLAAELAGYISSETNRLSALVTRFLDFARPLHAELTFQNIATVLDRALNDVAILWKGAAVRVERAYEANLPELPLDENLAEQAFLNIVQNAYDAMGSVVNGNEGAAGGVLRVSAKKSLAGGRDGIEVRIEDSGPGIPEGLREQIFNPFVTTKKTGVGLGLSIVSKIMDGHRGSIRIESAAGGACFILFFPAVVEDVGGRDAAQMVVS